MTVRIRFVVSCSLTLILLLAIVCPSTCEIHRAKAIKTKTGAPPVLPRFPPGAFSDHDEEVKLHDSDPDVSINVTFWLGHSTETWTYSMVSAMLVGLSGIFPLLVIPIETGRNLHHGAPAARLRLLLSFAVGGLLGDVFLHLLPEAWAHLDKEGHDHGAHMTVGLWIMVGLFSFLVIEKIFPDLDHGDQEDHEQDHKDSVAVKKIEQTEIITPTKESTNTPNTRLRARLQQQQNGINGPLSQNGNAKSGDNKKVSQDDGNICGYGANNGIGVKGAETKEEEPETTIKTSGWLNLLANVIDNFTHGLAVAGSYCVSTKTGLITTVAVLLHEVPHEIGDFAILLQSGFDRWKAAKAQLLTASGALIGAITALSAESAEAAGDRTAWILPFTSGGFIYIALVTVVPDLLKETNNWESAKQVVCLVLGIVMVAGLTLLCE